MIERHHDGDTSRSTALYSDCLRYRYRLTRHWGSGGTLAFIMLNPSTADEKRNDPTIARCENRARDLGFGGVDIVNLFALRATRPQDLKASDAPEGPENPATLRKAGSEAAKVIAAWGVHGTFAGQDERVRAWLSDVPFFALGVTKDGHPRHPLYVPRAAKLVPWTPLEQSEVTKR